VPDRPGQRAGRAGPEIARRLGCDDQTVRNTIHAFNTAGVRSLRRRPSRPRTVRAAFDAPRAERLRALLHQRPRDFGKATGIWTLDLAAAVSFEQGLTPTRVSGETIRATLARLGLKWKRAKRWLTSPDPEYARKKDAATA
jgi:transposase